MFAAVEKDLTLALSSGAVEGTAHSARITNILLMMHQIADGILLVEVLLPKGENILSLGLLLRLRWRRTEDEGLWLLPLKELSCFDFAVKLN